MLEVLFTQDIKVEGPFCGAPSGSQPSLFFSNYLFSLGFKPFQDACQHDVARMTDKADSSVVLAQLYAIFLKACNCDGTARQCWPVGQFALVLYNQIYFYRK